MQVWSKGFKAARKAKQPSKAAGDALPLLAGEAGQAAAACVAAMHAATGELVQALQEAAGQLLVQGRQSSAPTAAAAIVQQLDAASGGRLAQLVGWEPRMQPQAVVQRLLEEQRAVLARVQAAAAGLQQRLSGLAW
jgi:hypothetical protein